ncbi:MAG: DNA repair protein RecO [Clostridia bacterium]|nr:DNA repair protein RecO [Clostridia bacterium]
MDKVMGLVIRTTDVGESDRLVTLLTPDHGKVTVKVRSCRTAKSKLRYAAQLFCLGEYQLAESRAGHVVIGCDTVDGFAALGTDPDAYMGACVVVEASERLAVEGMADADLFVRALHALKALAYDGKPLLASVHWLWQVLAMAGHRPSVPVEGEDCLWVDYYGCAIWEEEKERAVRLSAEVTRAVRALALDREIAEEVLPELFALLGRLLWLGAGMTLSSVKTMATMLLPHSGARA